MIDPFTLAYDHILDHYRNDPVMETGIVNAKHKIRAYRQRMSLWRRALSSGDVPSVLIQPSTGNINLDHSSNTIEVLTNYQIMVSTLTYDAGESLNPVVFAVLVSTNSLHLSGSLDNLTWQGDKFIMGTRLRDRTDGQTQGAGTGSGGLASLITLECQMIFQRDLIAEYINGIYIGQASSD